MSVQEGSLEISDIEPLILERKSLFSEVKRQNCPAKNEGTNLDLLTVHRLLPVHSLQRGKRKAAPPPHCGSLRTEQCSRRKTPLFLGDLTASVADWEACCPPPFAVCLLNLCSRLLRPILSYSCKRRQRWIWVPTPSTKQGSRIPSSPAELDPWGIKTRNVLR